MDDLNIQVIKKSPQLHAEISNLIASLRHALQESESNRRVLFQSLTTKLVAIINEFELQPRLLEKQLGSYVKELSELFLENVLIGEFIGNIIYAIARVCTFKTVALFFSSDVYLFDCLLERCHDSSEAVRFVCLLWLCNLVIVPFPIKTIRVDLPELLKKTAQVSLTRFANISRTQVAALILYSRLLSRPDCLDMLDSFLDSMVNYWPKGGSSQKLGTFLVVNKLLKRVQISQSHVTGVYSCIIGDLLESQISNMSLVYSIKILSKLTVSHITGGLFVNAAELINNLVNDILLSDVTFETNLRYAMAKALSTITKQLSYTAVNYQNQLIQFILDLVDPKETNVPKLHTVLLSLGYISLSKNLPVQFQIDCIELARQHLFFKVPKGTILIGSQIRDSACFLIWSIVRNLKHAGPTLAEVFADLLQMLVFDELLLKRCSIAVIQEMLGRVGKDLVQATDKGEFIVNFVAKLGNLRLDQHVNYQFIDVLYHDIDLSFLIIPLVDSICEEDGDGHYLNKLLNQPPALELVPKTTANFDEIRSKLKMANKWHILFQLDAFNEGYCAFDNFVFDESKLDMVKGYLYSLKYKQLSELDWHNLLKILKYGNLVGEMREVVSHQKELPMREVLYHLPHDRNLSCTVFYFPNLDRNQYQLLISIMKDERVDAVVRANMITNLGENLPTYFKLEDIYSLFDDYTTTDQGDVGSKVRIAAINLVLKIGLLDESIKLKLIRLSGELMDKIRQLSFTVLTGLDFSWARLLQYYHGLEDQESRVQFWRGITFTCGSFIGNIKIINEAFCELLSYRPKVGDFNILLGFLNRTENASKRDVKLVSMVLQMILKMFDANYQFENKPSYQELFVKCYNLHINTRNLTRVKTVLRIFVHISQRCPKLRLRVYDRFLWILKHHPSKELRAFVGETILFEVVDSTSFSRYEIVDWFDINHSDLEFIEGVLKIRA